MNLRVSSPDPNTYIKGKAFSKIPKPTSLANEKRMSFQGQCHEMDIFFFIY
jgi:hypothetical protein